MIFSPWLAFLEESTLFQLLLQQICFLDLIQISRRVYLNNLAIKMPGELFFVNRYELLHKHTIT
jgi:hypothetical protein